MRRWNSDQQWIIWVGLNEEQSAVKRAFGDECTSIHGGLSAEDKFRLEQEWLNGETRVMVTKTSIYGFGVNWQHCHKMAFVGLGDSYEQYYQAIRRCYRYGQTRVVEAHVILSDLESQIASNIARKERSASDITAALVAEMRRARAEVEYAA